MAGRRYVRVRCEIDEEGRLTPLAIIWDRDTTYEVRKVERVEGWNCMGTGRGQRFTIMVGTRRTYLFWDSRRWYVMERDVARR